jgi:hypothetical protein
MKPYMPSHDKNVVPSVERHPSGASQLENVMQEIDSLHKSTRIVTTPGELEALEREIRRLTDRLASLLLEQKVQTSLDSAEMEQGEKNC